MNGVSNLMGKTAGQGGGRPFVKGGGTLTRRAEAVRKIIARFRAYALVANAACLNEQIEQR